MKTTVQLISLLLLFTFFSSCQKEFSLGGGLPGDSSGYDPDAKRFIDASLITESTQKNAVNNLVIQLKNSSLWSKFMAIYPMVGGTANTTKWNLKDPRDLDAAYRLTFSGAPVFAATGILFPTASDYADTHLADSSIGGCTNASISYYSRTQNTISGYDMGCIDSLWPYNEMSIYSNSLDTSNSADNSEWFGFSENPLTTNTTGLFMLSSTATNVTRYRNGNIVSSRGSAPDNFYTNLSFLIGKSRVTSRPGQKECALATIGNGLSDMEALTFYNIVQNFESELGR
jgi:hypothetical protein